MILYRVFIENKKVINRVYWGGTQDTETKNVINQIKGKFPNEKWAWDNFVWGVNMDENVYTIHQCSVPEDHKDSSKFQNSLLINRDFMRYIYNMDTSIKTIEIFYKDGQVYPCVNLGSGITVKYITDVVNDEFELQRTQAIYVTGTNDDIWAWANSLKSGITMPISKTKTLHAKDYFKFQFNDRNQLVSVGLFAHLERTMVYGYGDKTYVEFTCDYADELTNIDQTEIVTPNYDIHGHRIAQNVRKDDIKEYIRVPKDDGSGEYEKVLLKDL